MVLRGVKLEKLVVIGLLFLAVACGSGDEQNGNQHTTTSTKPVVSAPTFNSDSAFAHTAMQVSFGPRIPNSTAHEKCGDWIISELMRYADTVIVQSFRSRGFDGKTLNGRNIIASFKPTKNGRIMLSSHWDTRPFADQDSVRKDEPIDGANDGASGVGILIEVARQLSLTKPDVGVDIILFDLEDYGQPDDSKLPPVEDSYCLGSQYWANNLHVPNYFARYGILLDMTGAANATFFKEGTSVRYAPEVVDYVWKIAGDAGFSDYFLLDKSNGIIDDHYYINTLAKIKMIDIVHYDANTPSHFWKHWHTHGDTIDKIDRNSLRATGQTLLAVLFSEISS